MEADPQVPQMRAVRFEDYGPATNLMVADIDRPQPKEGEVLVRVRATGVNALDWKLRAGYLQARMPGELPHTPGFDVAGTVEQVGSGVSDFTVGDDVFGRGAATYAEYAVAPVNDIALKPRSISFEHAATLPIGGVTAWVGLFDAADLQPGQRLLVQGGAGGVGSFVGQLGDLKGGYVIATTSWANVDYVRSLGADEAIDYTTTKFEDVVSDVDVVLDVVGGEVTDRSWGVLKAGGIMVAGASLPDP